MAGSEWSPIIFRSSVHLVAPASVSGFILPILASAVDIQIRLPFPSQFLFKYPVIYHDKSMRTISCPFQAHNATIFVLANRW
jgi:hypothetical protein